jgi:hypothetical protein
MIKIDIKIKCDKYLGIQKVSIVIPVSGRLTTRAHAYSQFASSGHHAHLLVCVGRVICVVLRVFN